MKKFEKPEVTVYSLDYENSDVVTKNSSGITTPDDEFDD